MTPEDDVSKNTEKDRAEGPVDTAAAAEQETDKALDEALEKVVDATNEEVEEGMSDSPAEAAGSQSDSAEEDDIDRAASAQTQAEAAIAKAMAGNDDPLGFGDQRMEGEDPAGEGIEVGDELAVLRAQLEESEAKVSNQADQLLRVQAEMENQRKRAQNDVTKAHKFALEKIALDLLPVKDSLEMGLQAATAEDAEPTKIIEGSELTLKMLAQALEKYNIVEINPLDEKFDPEFHQAMSMQPVEGKEPNTVASVLQKGYTLNDRLIRPALVMVAK